MYLIFVIKPHNFGRILYLFQKVKRLFMLNLVLESWNSTGKTEKFLNPLEDDLLIGHDTVERRHLFV